MKYIEILLLETPGFVLDDVGCIHFGDPYHEGIGPVRCLAEETGHAVH
jgi:hypothetical protein